MYLKDLIMDTILDQLNCVILTEIKDQAELVL
jgi:hypothetical protein